MTRYLTNMEREEALQTTLKYAKNFNETVELEMKSEWCLRFMILILDNKYLHQLLQTDRVFYDSVVDNVRDMMKFVAYPYCYSVKRLLSQVRW